MKWKTSRILLACVTLLFGSLYLGVAVLGQQWSDQLRYLLTLGGLLLTIVVCGAAVMLLFKLVGRVWDLLVDRQSAGFDLDPGQQPGDEPPSSKQE